MIDLKIGILMSLSYQTDHQIYRLDYQAPHFKVHNYELVILLDEQKTEISGTFEITFPNDLSGPFEIKLNGSDNLILENIFIDGKQLDPSEFIFDKEDITLILSKHTNQITIKNYINPSENSELSGIYLSNNMFFSDCEPQGFRNITYFFDRPDVMTNYRVKLIADKKFPTLLSNGNLMEEGVFDETHHYAIWEDPFLKPTYLFAIVAGDLAFIQDEHIRPDGSPVRLRVYADQKDIDRCYFALESLKKAMVWDEERFGLVCDLDFYNLVAVDDFNSGAMENKGLNLFNTSCILATPETATDADFNFIEAVVGHEYFHNWTGNRITCQDWFNLSLKEGLTVFREQEFIAKEQHPGIRRIEDVNFLRTYQFPLDQGPLSHSVRPDIVGSIENLYTTTTYEKGAEVIRLYQTILGKEGFNRGFQRYIKEFDGHAATIEDFYNVMQAENPRLFGNFPLWYSQKGTPILKVTSEYHSNKKELRVSLTQYCYDPVTKVEQAPMPIPVNYAMFSKSGEMLLEETFTLTTHQQCLLFHNIEEMPVISFLREFSAPVVLDYAYSLADLKTLITFETDYFAKWEALQNLIIKVAFSKDLTAEQKATIIGDAFEPLLTFAYQDPAFCAQLLTLADDGYYLGLMETEDILSFKHIRETIETTLATRFKEEWLKLYYHFQEDNIHARAIKNIALQFLAFLPEFHDLVTKQYYESANMTDINWALKYAVWQNIAEKDAMLEDFYQKYQNYPTLIDRWFGLQERNPHLTLESLENIVHHPAFSRNNPNRARAIVGAIGRNRVALATIGAPLYQWIANEILAIDKINSITAARLVTPFTKAARLPEPLQSEVLEIVTQMMKSPDISNNLSDQLKRIIQ